MVKQTVFSKYITPQRIPLTKLQTPFIQAYLERQSSHSVPQANLLWQFYAKNANYTDAARVLHDLANSNFPIPLEERIEYLSRAKSLCSVRVEPGLRTQLNEQATAIQDALDVANIQDDIVRAVKEDGRMADFRRAEMLKELDGKILPLTTVSDCGVD
jgi:nuclear pore complex protein Nup155